MALWRASPHAAPYSLSHWGREIIGTIDYHCAYSERVRRGKTLAETNKVYDVHIHGDGRLSAKVIGRSSPFYIVTATLSPLRFDHQKKILDLMVDAISNNQRVLTQVLHGCIPPSVVEAAERRGLNLLPTSASEFNIKCSCPDFTYRLGQGRVCKHGAAVLFEVIAIIDRSPSTIFSMRGLDLRQHMVLSTIAPATASSPLPPIASAAPTSTATTSFDQMYTDWTVEVLLIISIFLPWCTIPKYDDVSLSRRFCFGLESMTEMALVKGMCSMVRPPLWHERAFKFFSDMSQSGWYSFLTFFVAWLFGLRLTVPVGIALVYFLNEILNIGELGSGFYIAFIACCLDGRYPVFRASVLCIILSSFIKGVVLRA